MKTVLITAGIIVGLVIVVFIAIKLFPINRKQARGLKIPKIKLPLPGKKWVIGIIMFVLTISAAVVTFVLISGSKISRIGSEASKTGS